MVQSRVDSLFNWHGDFSLPARNLEQPLKGGPADGHVVELTPMLDEYYNIMGWDDNGIPTREYLNRLDLSKGLDL